MLQTGLGRKPSEPARPVKAFAKPAAFPRLGSETGDPHQKAARRVRRPQESRKDTRLTPALFVRSGSGARYANCDDV
jgi:hypothetical protein